MSVKTNFMRGSVLYQRAHHVPIAHKTRRQAPPVCQVKRTRDFPKGIPFSNGSPHINRLNGIV